MKLPWIRRPTADSDRFKVRVVERPTTHLRADEFRADKELVHLAAQIITNPNFQLLLAVMRNEHPGLDVLPAGADSIQRITKQAQCEGYTIALATLESLGTKANLPERLVSTFGAVEPQQETG